MLGLTQYFLQGRYANNKSKRIFLNRLWWLIWEIYIYIFWKKWDNVKIIKDIGIYIIILNVSIISNYSKEVLMIYKIVLICFFFMFLDISLPFIQTSQIHILISFLHLFLFPSCFLCFPDISHVWASVFWLYTSSLWTARALRIQEREGNARLCMEFVLLWVCVKLFWHAIDCANLIP